MKTCDILIVGGGIIGLGIAYELKFRQAKLRVTVLDKGELGKEASWASVGMLEPQLILKQDSDHGLQRRFYNLCRESQIHFEDYLRRIEFNSKIDCEYRKEGIVKLIPAGGSADAELAWHAQLGLRAIYWTPEETDDHEPALAQGLSAIHLPDNHQVENRKLLKAMEECCRRLGVELISHEAVHDLEVTNETVQQVRSQNESYSAAHYVLCAGSWSSQFASLKDIIPPIKPMRGQIVALQMPRPNFVKYTGYLDNFYYVPRNDGRLIVGSTVEDVGFNTDVSQEVIQGFIQKLRAIIPNSIAFSVIERWAGLRPCSPDQFPLLGETSLSNMSVATGHFRNGILLTPITARLIADMILDHQISPLMAPFSPKRFTH